MFKHLWWFSLGVVDLTCTPHITCFLDTTNVKKDNEIVLLHTFDSTLQNFAILWCILLWSPYRSMFAREVQFNWEILESIRLRSFMRAERAQKKHKRYGEVVSGSRLQELKKMCLNLFSRKWLKPSLNLTNNLTPIGWWIKNSEEQFSLMKKKKKQFHKFMLKGRTATLSVKFLPFSHYIRYKRIFKIIFSASHNFCKY